MTKSYCYRNLTAAICLTTVTLMNCWVAQLPLPIYKLLSGQTRLWLSIPYFDRLIEYNPDGYKNYLERGKDYEHFGYLQFALNDFNRAAKLKPEDPEIIRCRASTEYLMGDLSKALSDFTCLIESDRQPALYPALALDLSGRAQTYDELHESNLGLKDAQEAIKLCPSLAQAYLARAYAYLGLSQYTDALSDSLTVRRLSLRDGYYVLGLLCSAQACGAQQHWQKALVLCNSALGVQTHMRTAQWVQGLALWIRALAQYNLGYSQQAVDDASESIGLNPMVAAPYLVRASAYNRLGDYDQAALDTAQAHKIEPSLRGTNDLVWLTPHLSPRIWLNRQVGCNTLRTISRGWLMCWLFGLSKLGRHCTS